MKLQKVIALTVTILILLFPIEADAVTLSEWLKSEQSAEQTAAIGNSYNQITYDDMLQQYMSNSYSRTGEQIKINASEMRISGEPVALQNYNCENDVLVWENENEYISFDFYVQKSGLYALKIRYCATNDTTTPIVRSLKIDSELPFKESDNITLFRRWADDGKVTYNALGEQVRPSMKQLMDWQEISIYDAEAMHDSPLEWYLEEGVHTVTLTMIENPMAISSITFYSLTDIPDYAQVLAEYKQSGYPAAKRAVNFEAEENVLYKNLSVIRATSDSDPEVTPSKAGKVMYNTIGGTLWQESGSSVIWQFSVEEEGLYQLAFHLKQSYRNGLPVYRRIEVDSEIPFKEFKALKFSYHKKWQTYVAGDEKGETYLLYLKPGTHTLSMTSTMGETDEIVRMINKDSVILSQNILKIIMITGQSPDPNYDYQLDKRVPGLINALKELTENIDRNMELIKDISGGRPSLYSQLNMSKKQITELIRNPYSIAVKIDDLNNVLSTYGTALTTLKAQPLMLDNIMLVPAGETVTEISSTFGQRLWGGLVNFINSFTKDYELSSTVGDEAITNTLDVWVARGKDWGNLIQQLADSDFTKRTHIGIKIHILPSGQLNTGSANALLLAVSSGMAPDIGLGTPVSSVGEFAIRNAVLDITGFSDYDEVITRFKSDLMTPLSYRTGVYGLPETQNFKVLLYRKDILNELGISIPKTWTELYNNILPVLYQNNMQFYYPMDFDPFIYQLDGNYYNKDMTESALDTPEAFQGITELFELFTVYGIPVSQNFFNRFRTGECPIGVGTFTEYMQICAAAPEIKGRWGIAVIPGHVKEDGSINHSQGGAVSESAMIMSQTDDPDGSWEFLKWWTSDEVQKQFGNEIEAIKGETARWNTANSAAFASMPWPQEDIGVILEALSQTDHTEVVLGGYFSVRHLINAFNRTCISGTMNARDSIEKATIDIDKELLRKQQSAGLTNRKDKQNDDRGTK